MLEVVPQPHENAQTPEQEAREILTLYQKLAQLEAVGSAGLTAEQTMQVKRAYFNLQDAAGPELTQFYKSLQLARRSQNPVTGAEAVLARIEASERAQRALAEGQALLSELASGPKEPPTIAAQAA